MLSAFSFQNILNSLFEDDYFTLTELHIKPDITTREDIEQLMRKFYQNARSVPELNTLFFEKFSLDLNKHIPIFCDFWEMVIFEKYNYRNNLFDIHLKVHQKYSFSDSLYHAWINNFRKTIHELFSGPNADKASARAELIIEILKSKLNISS